MLMLINVRFQLMQISDYAPDTIQFIEKTFACDSRMSGVVSRINKYENPVFKLFVNFSCLENFRLYGIK